MKELNTSTISFCRVFIVGMFLFSFVAFKAQGAEECSFVLNSTTMEYVMIDEIPQDNAVRVTPSEVIVNLPFDEQSVVIYDITGRVCYKNMTSGEGPLYISRTSLPMGVLIIEIVSKDKQRRILKIRL